MIRLESGTYYSYDMIGEFHSSGEWIHPRRKIDSFEILLVLDGEVYIAEEAKEYILQKNQLLVLEPHKEHYGYKTVSEPVAFYWLHFLPILKFRLKSTREPIPMK